MLTTVKAGTNPPSIGGSEKTQGDKNMAFFATQQVRKKVRCFTKNIRQGTLRAAWIWKKSSIGSAGTSRARIKLRNTLCPFLSSFKRFTSSTAQGGGGSFKNRKPIGEVGCCESRKEERSHWWTERWLRSPLCLSLSFVFSDYLPIYLPIHLFIDPSIYLSTFLT